MKRILLRLLPILVFLLLWFQARLPAWNAHMQVDIWVFWERINYFLSHNSSFAGMRGNEVLPATLLYLFVPMGLVPAGALSYANFLPAMLLVNLVVVIATYYLSRNRTVLLLELLFLGPLLLFRFDGLVVLLLIAALLAFEKNFYARTGFFIGLAIGMKVFPIIVLPYLMLILLKKSEFKGLMKMLIGVGEALLLPLVIFAMLGGSWEQVKIALSFHSQKLISIESVPGSLITLWHVITKGSAPELLPGNGIWSVAGPVTLFNKIWIIPIGLLYGYVSRQKRFLMKMSWQVILAIILVFLVVSKNLNPQYLWWAMAIVPFVRNNKLMILTACGVALLNQLVYPLFYTTLIDNFYKTNQDYWIYYCLLARNLGVVLMMYMAIKELGSKVNDK